MGKRHDLAPVRSAGSLLRAGHVPVSRAWLLGPTTKVGPERRGGYGTTDPLADVLAPGYFALGSALLRPGELIYLSVAPRQSNRAERAEAHLALVMVRADARSPERADGSVRLVQDFGRPGDPAGTDAPGAPEPATPVRRGRGRAPRSRTRKAPATPTANALEPSPPG